MNFDIFKDASLKKMKTHYKSIKVRKESIPYFTFQDEAKLLECEFKI